MSTSSMYGVKRHGARADASTRGDTSAEEGYGWLIFAASMLGLAGVYNFFEGIFAIAKASFWVDDARYVFSDLRTWGWIVMFLGLLLLFATWQIFTGSQFARWFGMVAAGLNAIGQLMFVQAYPFWSLALFACDVLVIYALARYAGPRLRQYDDLQ
jgi:hypothetical protein